MRIEDVIDNYEQYLLAFPNVTGLGIGEQGGKPIIIVFVRKKVEEKLLNPNEIIPKSLDGYEIDVQEEIIIG